MVRRFFLASLAALCSLRGEVSSAPADLDRLNNFAERYNAYVMALQNGVVDLRLWRRVTDAWRRIF